MGYIMRRFLRTAMIVFSWFVVPYSKYTNIKVNRKKLPPIKSHLLEIPAVDLAKLIRTRQVKLWTQSLNLMCTHSSMFWDYTHFNSLMWIFYILNNVKTHFEIEWRLVFTRKTISKYILNWFFVMEMFLNSS